MTNLAVAKKAGGVNGMLAEYRRLRQARPASDFDSGQLNRAGYQSLRADHKTDEAIRIFKLNVEMFPADADAYDSLGEAYMAGGQKDLAIACYRRSLELNAANDNAIAMLEKMGVVWKPSR